MSNFHKLTKNPDTGEWENAAWIDSYYGNHRYGVRFESGLMIDPEKVELETKEQDEMETNKAPRRTITVEGFEIKNKVPVVSYLLKTYHHNGTSEERGYAVVGEEIDVNSEEEVENNNQGE